MKTILLLSISLFLFGTANAQTWYDFPTDLEPTWVKDYKIVNDNVHILTTNYGSIMKSSNGGVNWTEVQSSPYQLDGIYFPSDNVGYIAGSNDTYYKTIDGGDTWVAGTLSGHFTDAYFVDESIGFLVGTEGSTAYIWKTTDGGANWNQQFVPSGYVQDIDFLNSTVGFLCGNDVVYKTTDQGATWSNVYTGGTTIAVLNQIDVIDANNIVVCGGLDWQPVILKSADGGTTWNQMTHPLDQTYNSIWEIEYDGTNVFAVSGDAVLRSTDLGTTWTMDAVSATGALNFQQIEFSPNGIRFVCGGGYLFTDTAIVNGIEEAEINNDYVVYPNPTVSDFSISFSKTDAIKDVRLFDLQGREINSTLIDAGQSLITLDWMANLESGTYILEVATESGSSFERIQKP